MAPKLSADERRNSILMAAVPLFANNGFNGTTTREIAKAAGVSEALLYRHFPSKETLYAELQGYCTAGKDQAGENMELLEPSTSTLVFLVHFVLKMIYEGIPGLHPSGLLHSDMNRMMINSFLEDGAFARFFLKGKADTWIQTFNRCFDAADASGDMEEDWIHPSARMWFVHHLGVALALLHLPEEEVIDYGFGAEEMLPYATRFCLRGMGMRTEAIKKYYNPSVLALFTERLQKS